MPVTRRSPIPSFLLPIYRDCGHRYGVPWRVLAAINQVETGFGANLNVSSAGAVGWMQFIPSSWRAYGVDSNGDGRRDPYDPEDAICAAGRYLRAAGAHHDLRGAIFAYNHAGWYVEMVMALARSYADVRVRDPLPRARRLKPAFARSLERVAKRRDVQWEVILAVLRARGQTGRVPASLDRVRALARRLSGPGGIRAFAPPRALPGSFERKVRVLIRYNRAVGLRGLTRGLHEVRDELRRRVLRSDGLEIYPGGRADIAAGRIDVRVLATLLCLGQKYEEVSVSSLMSGHGYYARPGVPSAHAFGEAVDIAALGDVPIVASQKPGGITERAVLEILRLPRELRPAQVISLFDAGGPSFAAADHHDHIHVGY